MMIKLPIALIVLSILITACGAPREASSGTKMTLADFMRNRPSAWSVTNRDQCDVMQSPLHDECLITIAKNENDISLCERLPSEPYQGIPAELSPSRDNCIFKVAEHSSNVELCSGINSPTAVGNCLTVVLPLATISEASALIPLDQRTKYSVFCEMIQPTNDYEVTQKAQCFSNAAIYEMNPSLCEKSIVPNSLLFNGSSCFHEIATSLNRTDICDRITFDSLRQACKNTVAIRLSKGIGPKQQ